MTATINEAKIQVAPENAGKFKEWLATRGGIAIWHSADLGDPGKTWSAPYLGADGQPKKKESWQMEDAPRRVVTDIAQVEVVTDREVKRFHVGVQRGSGLSFTLTSAASRRVRKELAKAGPGAGYGFDYMAQDCIITVPDKVVPLADWTPEAK
jgi:hypothetical protein